MVTAHVNVPTETKLCPILYLHEVCFLPTHTSCRHWSQPGHTLSSGYICGCGYAVTYQKVPIKCSAGSSSPTSCRVESQIPKFVSVWAQNRSVTERKSVLHSSGELRSGLYGVRVDKGFCIAVLSCALRGVEPSLSLARRNACSDLYFVCPKV